MTTDAARQRWWLLQLADRASGTPRQWLLLDAAQALSRSADYRPPWQDRLRLWRADRLGSSSLHRFLKRLLPAYAGLYAPPPLEPVRILLAFEHVLLVTSLLLGILLVTPHPTVLRAEIMAAFCLPIGLYYGVRQARQLHHRWQTHCERQLAQLAELEPQVLEQSPSLAHWLQGMLPAPSASVLLAQLATAPGSWRDIESMPRFAIWQPLPEWPWRQWLVEVLACLTPLVLLTCTLVGPRWLTLGAWAAMAAGVHLLPWKPAPHTQRWLWLLLAGACGSGLGLLLT